MTYYLAGPMSGHPQFNFPAFFEAQKVLEAEGLTIVSPAEIDNDEDKGHAMASPDGDMSTSQKTWGEFLARDVKMIADTDIDAIVLLPEWETSKGARLEVFVCMTLNYPVFFYQANGTLKQLDYTRVMADIMEGIL